MNVVLTNILGDLKNLYAMPDRLERFRAYAALSSGKTRGEPLPLGTFSPMGERQADYLEHLVAIDAETLAQRAANEVAGDFATFGDSFRLLLVVADVPRNGWTQRQLTDAQWRFTLKDDALPKGVTLAGFDRWVSVLLWTDTEATEAYVRKEVRGALYRALSYRYLGAPRTLAQMLRQEGRVLAYAGYRPELDEEELHYSREALEPYLQSAAFPVCFAALYGDEAARSAGHEALGLTAQAGFQLALFDTLPGEPRESLRTQADSEQAADLHPHT